MADIVPYWPIITYTSCAYILMMDVSLYTYHNSTKNNKIRDTNIYEKSRVQWKSCRVDKNITKNNEAHFLSSSLIELGTQQNHNWFWIYVCFTQNTYFFQYREEKKAVCGLYRIEMHMRCLSFHIWVRIW